MGKAALKIDIENWIYPKIQVIDWQTKKVPDDLKGKIIVLDFWFTHCAPCLASIPDLNHLAKQFPEVVFISISFEQEKILNEFLNKMIMYYPVGSDPEFKTIRAFGVEGYPQTYLIDQNGIVQWQGDPFQLNKTILNKALGQDETIKNKSLKIPEIPSENAAYSFTFQKHVLGLEHSSYYHSNPYDINVYNKDLADMHNVFYGINRSRIISIDSALLNTTYDLTLKADKEITTEANCVEMLKFLLSCQLGITITKVSKDTIVNIVVIENDSLLNRHISSDSKFIGTTIRYDNWEAKGATLENLKDFIENEYNILVDVDQKDNRNFDFIIPMKDIDKAKEILKSEYGLNIKREIQKTAFWKIN